MLTVTPKEKPFVHREEDSRKKVGKNSRSKRTPSGKRRVGGYGITGVG